MSTLRLLAPAYDYIIKANNSDLHSRQGFLKKKKKRRMCWDQSTYVILLSEVICKLLNILVVYKLIKK